MTNLTMYKHEYELNAFEKGLHACYGMSRQCLRQTGYHHDNKVVVNYINEMAFRTDLCEELMMEAEDIALNINTGYFDGWSRAELNGYIRRLVEDVVGRQCYLTKAINIRNVCRVIEKQAWDHVRRVPFTNEINWLRGRG